MKTSTKPSKPFGKRRRSLETNNLAGYLFIGPWLIGFFAFIAIPFFSSLWLSFTDFNIIKRANFIGLQNYKALLDDPAFWQSLKVTFLFTFVSVPLKLMLALAVAMLLNTGRKLIGLYRAVFYLPSLIGGSVAVAVVWRQLFSNSGLINLMLSKLGIESIYWFTDTRYSIWVLIILATWQFGAPMLIFLASLKQISASYYEAAKIDGANSAQTFFHITIPTITPVIFFNLIMQLIGAFMSFTQSYIITEGGPLNSTLFYALNMYRQSFEFFKMGYGAAMAWIMLMIITLFTALIFKSSSYWVFYEEGDGL